MPRKNLIRTDEYPYHVYARANNKEWFSLPMEEVWEIFTKLLLSGTKLYDIDLHCYVLMTNHYHLLLRTPEANLDQFMHFLNHKMSLAIGTRTGRINRIFGTRYKWSLIQYQRYYLQVYRYIYQNPIRSKSVKRVEDYPFNSINKFLPNPIKDQFSNLQDTWIKNELAFLNEIEAEKSNSEIQKGLKKTIFMPVVQR